MPSEALVFECYGHGAPGCAVALAGNRAQAIQTCREWLGWDTVVAFRAPEKYSLWIKSGGTLQTPIVYAADGEHYVVIERAMESAATTPMRSDVGMGWEERYERE